MTWVRNRYAHPYQPSTGGPAFGANEAADIDLSGPLEQDALATGGLLLLDPNYVPPPPPPPDGDGAAVWREAVATFDDLPATGNTDGDVREVLTPTPRALWTWVATPGEWQQIAGGSGSGGGGSDIGDAEMPVIATNLAGLGAGTYDGQPGIIRLGSDFYEEEFTWNASAGRWIGTRTHELISQIDTWGMDLSDYPLESIRQSWCRLRNAIPYGKSKAALTADFVIGTDTSMAVDNLGNFTASGQVFSRGRTWSYSGRSASSGAGNLTGLSLISGTNSGTLPGGDTIVWQLPGDVGGWGSVVRYLDHAGEMYAGGFELEERLKIHLNGSHDDVAMTVGVYYFNFNAGEDIAELGSVASPSGGLGFGITKTGPPDDLQTGRAGERPFQIGNAGWTLLAAGTPTKRFLIPMLFAKMESSTAKDNGEEYGAVLEARWRSIV